MRCTKEENPRWDKVYMEVRQGWPDPMPRVRHLARLDRRDFLFH